MSALKTGKLLDFIAPAFQVISGNASGTPKNSGAIRVESVESVDFALTTASTTNVTWAAFLSTKADLSDEIAHPSPPTFPTGTNQSATVNITVGDGYKYLRLTATTVSGTGAVTATPTMVYGSPTKIAYVKRVGVHFYCPSSATLAGQGYIDYSANYNPNEKDIGVGTLPRNNVEPVIWFPGTDVTDTTYTVPALVASTGQSLPLRLGTLEFIAIRARFAPSAGFGEYRVTYNAKS